jgi:hypothetical protein
VPNENKLAKAREVGLRIGEVCGNCVHRQVGMGGLVGSCKLHSYLHQKQMADARCQPFAILSAMTTSLTRSR